VLARQQEYDRKGAPPAKLVGRLVLCFLISALTVAAAPQHQKVVPAWSADLRSAVQGTPVPFIYGGPDKIKGIPVTSLWFLDNHTIVATFVTDEGEVGNPKLSGRKGGSLPLRLRAVFLDSSSGKVTATREWPSESRNAAIVATLGGKFVTETGYKLTLFGSDLKEIKSINLPRVPSPDDRGWRAIPSPTGQNILLRMFYRESGRWLSIWMWVETDSLKVVHSWDAPVDGILSITDNEIAFSTICTHFGCEPKLEIKRPSTDWTIIGPSDNHDAFFVNGDLLFLPGGPNTPALLIRANGKVVFSEKISSKGSAWCDLPVRSSGGKRFIAPGLPLKEHIRPWT